MIPTISAPPSAKRSTTITSTASALRRSSERHRSARKRGWIPFCRKRGTVGNVVLVWCCVVALAAPPNVAAIVTSDGVGTHVVTPGTPAFGVNLDGVVKLGGLPPFATGDEPLSNLGTGALISDTHVLTAAHVADKGPFLYIVQFDLADGPVRIPVTGYAIHPNYVDGGSNDDIAILCVARLFGATKIITFEPGVASLRR